MAVLQVKDLTKIFYRRPTLFSQPVPQKTAVNRISFELNKGEILGFLGANGAGKTTTIQMLLNLLEPTSGSIFYFGKDFATHRSQTLARIGFASSYVQLPQRLSLQDNLYLFAKLYGVPKGQQPERVKSCLQSFDLWQIKDQRAGTLSSGQSARLMIAKAFIANPNVVLLDEPTAALDPTSAQKVRALILEHREKTSCAYLFTSHNMAEVTNMCDRVLVLKNGSIIANNTPQELAKTVSETSVHLFIDEDMQQAQEYCAQAGISCIAQGHELVCHIDEQYIASFLQKLAEKKIHYSQISIKTPQLEDYFLHMDKG